MSNSSLLAKLSQLDDLTYGKNQWKTDSLTVKVAESLTSNVEHDLNIIETIGHDACFFFTSLREDNLHWLPNSFYKKDFKVFWSSKHQRWCLPMKQNGRNFHSDHPFIDVC